MGQKKAGKMNVSKRLVIERDNTSHFFSTQAPYKLAHNFVVLLFIECFPKSSIVLLWLTIYVYYTSYNNSAKLCIKTLLHYICVLYIVGIKKCLIPLKKNSTGPTKTLPC
ncbi:hypothetical protein ILYODFUR_009539 [Ilyodon furcidens]|uniref:Uncharacterized protein n=1 Tax=Ilyodon furcidens TaxID=33524 RepID=A0ABV0VEY6_9TELE